MTTKKKDILYSDDVRLSLLEQSINHINDTLIRFEKRFDKVDDQFKEIRKEFKSDLAELKTEIKSEIKWVANLVMGLYGTIAVAVLGAIAKFIFHG